MKSSPDATSERNPSPVARSFSSLLTRAYEIISRMGQRTSSLTLERNSSFLAISNLPRPSEFCTSGGIARLQLIGIQFAAPKKVTPSPHLRSISILSVV
ncbi:hypothetical protein KY285_021342 [Solanum tuberosum]|nr:hypothetical protein KY285_021342 [Solanum tuberosum]